MNRKFIRIVRVLPKLMLLSVVFGLCFILLNDNVHVIITTNTLNQDKRTIILETKVKEEYFAKPVLKLKGDYIAEPVDITLLVTPPSQQIIVNETNANWTILTFKEIINPHPFEYIRVPTGVCSNQRQQRLLILVKSNVFQFGHRIAIRSTWGNFSDGSIQIAFLLGYSPLVEHFAEIEAKMYQDIIQENFLDEYKNNTIKTIMGFNWVVSNCNHTKFVLFVDDDYFVNIQNVADLVDKIISTGNETTFMGYRYMNARPRRSKSSKWYVSEKDYPSKYWPPYISGGSMLISMDNIVNMTGLFPYVKSLFIDDVYLGIVAQHLNITLTHDKRFETTYVPTKLQTILSSHEYGSPHNLIDQWNEFEHVEVNK